MHTLTFIVAAEEDEYPDIAQSNMPLDEWSGIESPGLDTTKIASLHSLLTGNSLQAALDRYEPVFISGDEEETVVLRIDDELFDELLELDDDAIENVATELAATDVYEEEGTDPEEVQFFLSSLVDLAQLAESQEQKLFIWLRLLQN